MKAQSWSMGSGILFAVVISAISWLCSFAGAFGRGFTISVPSMNLSVDTQLILLSGAVLLPVIFCLRNYPEPRASLRNFKAGFGVYLIALVATLLPLSTFLGARSVSSPRGASVGIQFAIIFVGNLLLSPLWEEILWRGTFQSRIRSFSSGPVAILAMSVGWAIWHTGYLPVLYASGTDVEILRILPLTYLFIGIVLGSIFELGRGSLWPCILLHAGFDSVASVFCRATSTEIGSHIAEIIVLAMVSILLFGMVILRDARQRRSRKTVLVGD